MNESDVWLSLSREVSLLHRETSWFQLISFALALILATWVGKGVRTVVAWSWMLNLDRRRNLASLGTMVQLGIVSLAVVGMLAHGLRTAPGVTLLVVLVGIPTAGVLLRGVWQNLLAGLLLIFQRQLREGDDIQLSDGRTGKIKQIRLTSTYLIEGRTELILPNVLLISRPVQKLPPQPGILLRLVLAAPRALQAEDVEQARRILIFSPFRAVGSEVSVKELSDGPAVELSLRVFADSAKDPATRELGQKVPQALKWGEPTEQP